MFSPLSPVRHGRRPGVIHTQPRVSFTHSRGCHSYSRGCHSHSRRCHSHSRRCHSHTAAGVIHTATGVIHIAAGVIHTQQQVSFTHSRGCHSHTAAGVIHTQPRVSFTQSPPTLLCCRFNRLNGSYLWSPHPSTRWWRPPLSSSSSANLGSAKNVRFDIARYPVLGTARSISHFTPWLTCSVQRHLDFSG